MPLVTCRPFIWPNLAPVTANSSWLGGSIGLLNAAASRAAFIFQIDYAGTLDWGEFRMGTVTNAPANGLRVSFQSLDASNNPDNIESQYRVIPAVIATGWQTPGLMTSDGTDGGTKRTVAVGDKVAYVIRFESFLTGNSVQPQGSNSSSGTPIGGYYSASSTNSGSTWNKATDIPLFALKYSDGVYRTVSNGSCWPVSANNVRSFNSGSTPDERAMRFQVPFNCRVRGVMLYVDTDNPTDIILYDASSNVLATVSAVNSWRSEGNPGYVNYVFTTAQTLTRNTTYRLSVKPTSGSNIVLQTASVASAARLGSMPWGSEIYSSTRTDGGAWSDDQTELLNAYLIIDGLFDGDNSGSQFAFG